MSESQFDTSDNSSFDSSERESRAILGQARNIDLSPSPFLASRIYALVKGRHGPSVQFQVQLLFWKVLAGMSLALAFGLAIFLFQAGQPSAKVDQSYVIHVDFSAEEIRNVASAEVELPDGVHFASDRDSIRAQRKMKLPFHVESEGKFKLPFVVRSEVAGVQVLKIHLFDENDNLIKERALKVKFAKQQNGLIF